MAGTKFRVVPSIDRRESPKSGEVLLHGPDNWDDYGYKSSFRVYARQDDRLRLIGVWKILNTEQQKPGITEIPSEFSGLQEGCISLAQDRRSYEKLGSLNKGLAISILEGLRDVVYQPRDGLEDLVGFTKSLARFAEARAALSTGRQILERLKIVKPGKSVSADKSLDLHIRTQLSGFPEPHELDLSFSSRREDHGLRRRVVIVGPNGVGKTQLLATIARALSGLDSEVAQITPVQPFSHIVAVSYSAFDQFKRPKMDGDVSYNYCGLRTDTDASVTLDLNAARDRAVVEIQTLDDREIWCRALHHVDLTCLANLSEASSDQLRAQIAQLSAGLQIAALMITNLCAHLIPGSLVLYDEPEVHLHPRLLSGLLRALQELLEHFDSHAIIATHSLVPLQETPSSNIVILNRPESQGAVKARSPIEQCFAATLDEISRLAFGVSVEDQTAVEIVSRLAENMSKEQIQEVLGGKLSLGTRLLIASVQR